MQYVNLCVGAKLTLLVSRTIGGCSMSPVTKEFEGDPWLW
jgi:hypothetical protein